MGTAVKYQQKPQAVQTKESDSPASPAPEAQGPQAGVDRDSLKSMNYVDGAAAVAPVQAKASGAPVQMDRTAGAITELSTAVVDKMIAALKPTAGWPELVEMWRQATNGGADPISPSDKDDITIELLIMIESAFTFDGEASLDALWDDNKLMNRALKAVEKAATPEEEKPVEEEPEAPPVVLPKPGTFGIVTEDAELILEDSSKITLKSGECVETRRGHDGRLVVEVQTGQAGKVGTIDPALFKQQPRLTKEDDGSSDDYSYQKYEGELFLARDGVKAPTVQDVDQGSIGDCYLIAAMGAVVASNPGIIENMISFDSGTGLFTVTFQEMQRGGTFKPHKETVDTYMPTRRGGGDGPGRMAYAMSDSKFNPNNQALWPAIIEKAYAKWKGGYDEIGDGGVSSKAMESFTGVRSTRAAMPSEDKVVPMFEKWQAENKAVVCGTLDEIQQRSIEGIFEGTGSGPYRGTLKDKEGNAAEVKKNTLSIRDGEGNSGRIRDDGKGELNGSDLDNGTVNYDGGATAFTYKDDKGPAAAADLKATYEYEGTTSQDLNIHGDHAYIFREVKDGMLQFHNPWGPAAHKHPKPVTGAQFRQYFQTIGVNAAIPQQNDD